MIKFMEKFVYQMFILGLENTDEALKKGLGGVIFFTKDINSEEQLVTDIKNIKEHALIPPFISIDQEGGRVERTENIRPKRLSQKYAYQKGLLKTQSEEIASELVNWGFNLNFAPCVDVNTNPNNPIIGERSFSSNPEEVIEGMNIVINSMRKYGIIPCVKHFPGHGDADKDSHLTLPIIDLPLNKMEKIHIKPFKAAVENKIEMIMAAHLYCTCFDKEELPASLSSTVLGYLRNTLGYKGVIISDDMVMKGVQAYGTLEACIMGIKAGINMFIFRNSDEQTLDTINQLCKAAEHDSLLKEKITDSYNRIIKLKKSYGFNI